MPFSYESTVQYSHGMDICKKKSVSIKLDQREIIPLGKLYFPLQNLPYDSIQYIHKYIYTSIRIVAARIFDTRGYDLRKHETTCVKLKGINLTHHSSNSPSVASVPKPNSFKDMKNNGENING